MDKSSAPRGIHPVMVPKWGLTMEEGTLVAWHVSEGATVSRGDELVDIETSKISNSVEAPQEGVLRRQVGKAGQTYPCGALIGVIAEASVPDEEISSFVAAQAQASQEPRVEVRGPAPHVIEVGHHALRYLTQGAGRVPIVFLHGLGGDLNNWLFVQPPLSSGRATYALDLPGHGGSGKDLSGLNGLTDVAGVIAAFLDRVGVGRAHFVAHSLGAAIALDLARERPERVASLTLLSAAGLGAAPAGEFINGLIAAKSRREMTAVLRLLLADEGRMTREMVDDLLRYKRLDGAEASLQQYARFLAQETRSASQALSGISAPVHIIWGAQDRILPVPSQLPAGISLAVLPGVGHLPHLEKAAEVVELIHQGLPE